MSREELKEDKVDNLYVSVKDGGDIYRDNGVSKILIGKKVFISFKNDTMDLVMEIQVDSKKQNITRDEFLLFYGYYVEFLGKDNIDRLIRILDKEIPKLFRRKRRA